MAETPDTKLSAQGKILLIGRDDEIAALNALLRDCVRGQGAIAVIRGPVASGKTVLLRAFAAQAATAGAVFLGASASRAECGLPLNIADQLLSARSFPAAVAPQVADLIEGRARLAPVPAPEIVGPALARVFEGLLRLLTVLGQDRPVVIAVDDVHHADVASLQCLSYLARRAVTARILLVLTEDTHTLPADRMLHAEILRRGHCHCFPLAPLSPSSVARLLAEHIDAAAAQQLAPAAHAITGGSPALVSALGKDSRTDGHEAGHRAGHEAGHRAGHEVGLVARTEFRSAVVTCLHRYEPGLVELGQAIAVLGDSATPALLAEVLAINPESVARGLDALGASGLLDAGRFRHEQARQAVLGHLTADERKVMHASAAQALHRTGAAAATQARHLVGAHRIGTRWAVAALQEAAEQALADGEVPRAVDYLRRAERECVDDRQHAAVMFALVRAQWPSDPECAARYLPELAANARTGLLDKKFLGELPHYLLWMGDMRAAAEILAAPDSGSTDASRLDFLYPEVIRTMARLRTRGTSPFSAAIKNDSEAIARAAGGILAERNTADPTLASITTALMALICEDMLDRAAWWCTALLRESDVPSGSPLWDAVLTAALAMIETQRGNFLAAQSRARKALTLLSAKAWGVAIGAPLSVLLLTATARRDHAAAAACLRTPVPEAMFGTFYGLLYLYARGEHYLATGCPQKALRDFSDCGNRMAMWHLDLPSLIPWRPKAAAAHLALAENDRVLDGAADRVFTAPAFGAVLSKGESYHGFG